MTSIVIAAILGLWTGALLAIWWACGDRSATGTNSASVPALPVVSAPASQTRPSSSMPGAEYQPRSGFERRLSLVAAHDLPDGSPRSPLTPGENSPFGLTETLPT